MTGQDSVVTTAFIISSSGPEQSQSAGSLGAQTTATPSPRGEVAEEARSVLPQQAALPGTTPFLLDQWALQDSFHQNPLPSSVATCKAGSLTEPDAHPRWGL